MNNTGTGHWITPPKCWGPVGVTVRASLILRQSPPDARPPLPPVVCTNLCTGEAASTALHTHTMLMNRLQHRQVTKNASIWSSQ